MYAKYIPNHIKQLPWEYSMIEEVERRMNGKQDTSVTVESWNKRIPAMSMYEKKISRKKLLFENIRPDIAQDMTSKSCL